MISISQQDEKIIYNLIIFFQSLSENGKSVILSLSHIHPTSLTAESIAKISGIPIKELTNAKTLENLESQNLLIFDSLDKKNKIFSLNIENQMLNLLVNLAKNQGQETRKIMSSLI